jgi:predicted CoA-substrate-specific enzyme activase
MALRLNEIIQNDLLNRLPDITVVGIDIGSRSGKGVLLSGNELHTATVPTGFKTRQSVEAVLAKLLEDSDISIDDVTYLVGTGIGRISIEFGSTPHQTLTETTCLAMGAHALNPRARTIIDIGSQDAKVIKIDARTGTVQEFVLNDSCAAGTGRILEKTAHLLDLDLRDLGDAALLADQPTAVSNNCVIFSESEVLALLARGERRENIAAGIHHAVAVRMSTLLDRIGLEPEVVFTGGVANNSGMRKALSDQLNIVISATPLDSSFAGALGAAIYAATFYGESRKKKHAFR